MLSNQGRLIDLKSRGRLLKISQLLLVKPVKIT